MPTNTKTTTTPAIESYRPGAATYAEALVYSLLFYAKINDEFSKELKIMADNVSKKFNYEILPVLTNNAKILTPENIETACARAEWIIDNIEKDSLPGSSNAGSILKAWSKGKIEDKTTTSPKQLVVGVVRVAIPGITLGRVKRKKKKVSIIVREDLLENNALHVAQMSTKACAGIISQALVVAGGKADKLEPEISDWIFGEREIVFYTAGEKKMREIKSELEKISIIHAYQKENEKLGLLAISPEVNSRYQELLWRVKPIKL